MTGPLVRPEDTPEQARVLRRRDKPRWINVAARVRRRFYPGTRVIAVPGVGAAPRPGALHGTVERHVPGLNAQGGHLLVRWDSGVVGRVGACSLVREDSL